MTPARRAGTALMAGALALGGMVAAACGVQPTGVVPAGPGPVATGSSPRITVYLVRAGRVVPVARPGLPSRPYLAVEQLAVSVSPEERRRGFSTELPQRVAAVVVVEVSDRGSPQSVLNVLEQDPKAPGVWPRLAYAQLACTAEAIPGVERVELQTGPGERPRRVGTCRDYRDVVA